MSAVQVMLSCSRVRSSGGSNCCRHGALIAADVASEVLCAYQCSDVDEGETVDEVAEGIAQQLGEENHCERSGRTSETTAAGTLHCGC